MYVRQSYITVLYLIVLTVERPTRREVLIQLADVDALWRSIGDGLGVSDNDLQGLANANMQDLTRLGHVIQNWLDMNGQSKGALVNWMTILDVVKGPLVKKKAHAMTIYEYLKQGSSVQQSTQSKWTIRSIAAIFI